MTKPQVHPVDLAKAKLASIYEEADRKSAKSLRAFLDCVVADAAPEPKQYGLIEEWWQKERNARIIPPAEFICGIRPDYKGPMRLWEGYQKGCDKTGTIARICCWLLAYSRKSLRIYVGACDADQASVVYDAMQKTALLNKNWLGKRLEFQRGMVRGKDNGAYVKILPADAAGTAGITPDVVICEELTSWSNIDFWNQLLAGSAKRAGKDPQTGEIKSHCLMVILTNAGVIGGWPWHLREQARTSPNWSFFEQPPDTIYPSWLSREILEQTAMGMTRWEARRLLWNHWISEEETGEKFFEPSDIDACVGSPEQPPAGARVYLGIDYGERKDRTALSVVWMDQKGIIHVPTVDVWQGTPDKPVQLEDVEQWVRLQWGRYPNAIPVFDPHQLLYLMQKLEKENREFRKFDFRSGKNNLLMADNLRFLFKQRKIVLSLFTGLIGGSTLVDELKQLIGEQKSYGVRMQHTRNSHDDRSVSIGMACLCAVQEQQPQPAEQVLRPADPQLPALKQADRFERGWTLRHGLFGLTK